MQVEIGGYAWLDRAALLPRQVANLVDRLTIQPRLVTDIPGAEPPAPIALYALDEARNLLGVPRGFYRTMRTGAHEEVLRVGYGAPMRPLETTARFEGPYAEQAQAVEVLLRALCGEDGQQPWGGALLQAQPAFGKTATAIEVARIIGRRALILVHQEFLLHQWVDRIGKFLPDAVVGIIQQDRCEHQVTRDGRAPDFVIALLQSLARDTGGRYPQDLYGPDTFGLVASDETHRIGAASWCSIIPKFAAAYRIGLTATPRRKDGADDVFFYHIAPVTYAARTQTVRPRVRRIYTGTTLTDIKRGSYEVKVDKLNSAQIVNQLCQDRDRTRSIVDDLVQAVRAERKILVVSARLEHLQEMAEDLVRIMKNVSLPFPVVTGFYTGQWFTGERWETTTRAHRRGDPKLAPRTLADLEQAERANVIFATQQLVMEGLDIPALDVLVMATPISDVEQVVGRLRRVCVPSDRCEHWCPWRAGRCQGKPTPLVVDVVDERIPRMRGMAARRDRYYGTLGC
ncbi:MAG: DEAD/DEAH box helicase family protein [bacterium]